MSLEDERARQAGSAQPTSEPTPAAPAPEPVSAPITSSAPAAPAAVPVSSPLDNMTELAANSPMTGVTSEGQEQEDEDEELARALAMSRGEEDVNMDEAGEDDEVRFFCFPFLARVHADGREQEEEIRRAIALSLQGDAEEKDKK